MKAHKNGPAVAWMYVQECVCVCAGVCVCVQADVSLYTTSHMRFVFVLMEEGGGDG